MIGEISGGVEVSSLLLLPRFLRGLLLTCLRVLAKKLLYLLASFPPWFLRKDVSPKASPPRPTCMVWRKSLSGGLIISVVSSVFSRRLLWEPDTHPIRGNFPRLISWPGSWNPFSEVWWRVLRWGGFCSEGLCIVYLRGWSHSRDPHHSCFPFSLQPSFFWAIQKIQTSLSWNSWVSRREQVSDFHPTFWSLLVAPLHSFHEANRLTCFLQVWTFRNAEEYECGQRSQSTTLNGDESVTEEPAVSPVAAPVWLEVSKAEGLMLIRWFFFRLQSLSLRLFLSFNLVNRWGSRSQEPEWDSRDK